MLTIYLCFLAGGAVLPFVSFIMGSLSNSMDTDLNSDIDMDADFDTGADLGNGMDIHAGTDIGTGADIHTDTDISGGTVIHTGAHYSFDSNSDTDTAGNTHLDTHMQPGGGSMLSIGLIPTSLLSLSSLAITFGAVGALMTLGSIGRIFTFITALAIGYLMAVIIQTIIKSLKKIQTQNTGIKEKELFLYDGKIIDTILPGQMGTVSFVTLEKILVSYPAKCEDQNIKLETGKIVRAKEYQNGIFIVEPKNKYE